MAIKARDKYIVDLKPYIKEDGIGIYNAIKNPS